MNLFLSKYIAINKKRFILFYKTIKYSLFQIMEMHN